MALGEVSNVNVVSDAGSVGGRVIVSENAQLLSFAGNDFLNEGEQVVWVNVGFVSN